MTHPCLTCISKMESSLPGVYNSRYHIKVRWRHLLAKVDMLHHHFSNNSHNKSNFLKTTLKKNFLDKIFSSDYNIRLKVVESNQKWIAQKKYLYSSFPFYSSFICSHIQLLLKWKPRCFIINLQHFCTFLK